MRNLFQRKRRTLLLLAILALSFAVISSNLTQPAGARGGGFLEQLVTRLVTPLQRGVSVVVNLARIAWYNHAFSVKLKEKNEVMAQRIDRLEGELAALREQAAAAERLAGLLGYRDTHDLDLVVARLIGRDSGGLNRTLTLDKGSSDGVGANM